MVPFLRAGHILPFIYTSIKNNCLKLKTEVGMTVLKSKQTRVVYVTRYEKKDHSGYFIDSLFLVWIVSAISVESNSTSFVKKEAS